MNPSELSGRLVKEFDLRLAAPWAAERTGWVLAAGAAIAIGAAWFYLRSCARSRGEAASSPHRRHGSRRIALAVLRGVVLLLIWLILAEPEIRLHSTHTPRPLLWLLFDGSQSMGLMDEIPPTFAQLTETDRERTFPSRMDRVRALLLKKKGNLLARMAEEYRLQVFVLDRPDGVRAIDLAPRGQSGVDPAWIARRLTTRGETTPLGTALSDLARRQSGTDAAGLLIVSDFNHNTGPSPVATARRLGIPIFTLGVGAELVRDVGIELSAPPVLRQGVGSPITVTLNQRDFTGRTVRLKLSARHDTLKADEPSQVIGERSIKLSRASDPVEFTYAANRAGSSTLIAEVDYFNDDSLPENNRSAREVHVRAGELRVLFVEHEPTWEWRHARDALRISPEAARVGIRTFLRSADPSVRERGGEFLPALLQSRREFLSNDVLVLGDMPASAISPRFAEMTKEFVGTFGGGLVIVGGPRYSPAELAATPLADLLPVVVEPGAAIRDVPEYQPRLTDAAGEVSYMRLADDHASSTSAWRRIKGLRWYQPAARLHPRATALAVHPSELCPDGTPQPLVAVRRYGRGEVVYLAFNETWRLRRLDEAYHRRFWQGLIERLALDNAVSGPKRFQVYADRASYQPGDVAVITVEGYDAEYRPFSSAELSVETLVVGVGSNDPDLPKSKYDIVERRPGLLEIHLAIQGGEDRVSVQDPLTGKRVDARFQTIGLAAEQLGVVRNAELERELAAETGGRTFDFSSIATFPDVINLPSAPESRTEAFPLWNNWVLFLLVVGLMLGEWSGRKLMHLP